MSLVTDRLTRLLTLTGWKRNILLLLSGAILTLAFAPFFIWPAVFLALSTLFVYLQQTTSLKRAFWDGWWFGFGHFTTGLYWFAHALLTDAEQFAWLIPFAVLGIPAILSIYLGLVTLITRKLSKTPLHIWLNFAVFWLIAEIARAYLFSGFPWNLLGYVWGAYNISIQSASIFGVWGLSFITMLLASAPAFLVTSHSQLSLRTRTYISSIIAFTFIALLCFGWWRLNDISTSQNQVQNGTYLRLVQGNIAQHHKWDPAQQMNIFRTYVELSKQPSSQPISLIIWPESAIPFLPEEQRWVTHVIADMLPKGSFLASGALRIEREKSFSTHGFSIWNSLFTFRHDGKIGSHYDKTHLVPFGEYIPLRGFLPFKKITQGSTDFSQGDGLKSLHIPNIPPFSPLICYEVIFPDHVIPSNGHTDWMLNITNDAWFGDSSAPYQHLQMARFRAVEEGMPLIRSANTGISAIVDSYGRITHQLSLNQKGVVDAYLPSRIKSGTIYQEFGRYIIISFLILAISVTLTRAKL